MNLLATEDFTYYLKNVFTDWAIALFIFFAILIMLAVLFKGLKVGVVLLIIAAVIAGGFVLAAFITMLLTWESLQIIDFAIRWAPTILFVTIITVSTLVNAKRGLRKSLILLAQAVGACVVCIIFYYVCINSQDVDRLILIIVNNILGGNSLQNILGVSESCKSIREILVEFLPKLLGGDFQILLAENPQYILTLADMGFRIVFSVITIVLYYLLVFILYVIYFFAYPERRYKKKVNLAVTKNQTDRPYTKNHIGGGAVGLVRGITVGLLILSFLGSALFMVAGGMGTGTLDDHDFDNDEYNYYYAIYRSIDSYGSQGIFKILNSMTDANDTPFYLFAADMVLSGNLDDEENDIDNKNIKFREEIAAFTGFARDTINLLLKYGEDDIVAILNGKGGDNAFDTVVDVMSDPDFRTEFDLLIERFDAQTYIINLGVSLVNSIVANIDEISFTSSISEDNRELIKILFKKGYLSDHIPDERELKKKIEAGVVKPTDYDAPPRIKVSHLLTKDDIRLILGVTFSFITGEVNADDAIVMIRSLLPEIRQLSILQTSRARELDPVFARVYCYVENMYLTAEGVDGITYEAVAGKNIKWLNEINTLLDVADSALALWSNIYEEGAEMLDMALSMFDPDNADYEENTQYFDNIRSALENSQIIGTVMSTSFMYDMMTQAFAAISPNFYIPDNLEFNSTVNADGSITVGEMYNLFGGFKLLTSPKNRALLNDAMDYVGGQDVELTELLNSLTKALALEDDDGNTLSLYFTESNLLRSLLSIVMIENGADTIYIPKVSLDTLKDGTSVNMINKRELRQLLDNLSELINFVKPLLEDDASASERIKEIADYLQKESFSKLVNENRIYEGTVANLLSIFIADNEYVVVPQHILEDGVDGWVTQVEGGVEKPGELRNFMDALKLAKLDLVKIADGEFDIDELFNTLTSMDRYTASDFLRSEILHYTISKYLIGGWDDSQDTVGFKIIVPNGAREKTPEGENLEYIVKSNEIISLLEAVAKLDLSDDLGVSAVLYKLVTNKSIFDGSKENNTIIPASIVYSIVNTAGITDNINIPDNYKNAGKEESLMDFNSSNVWKSELPRFIDALDEILGISLSDEFEFNEKVLTDSLSNLLTGLNEEADTKDGITKLQLCYLSDIARGEITNRLDEVLRDNEIVSEYAITEAKSHGFYKTEELEALAGALEILGIEDFLSAKSDDIIPKVKGMALSLNKEVTGFDGKYDGKTGLDVIYPSTIIRYIFTDQIDEALEGHIEPEVTDYIKAGRKTYPKAEIVVFLDAIEELGITEFDGLLADFTLDEIGDIEVIYSSRIIAGVISKSLYEALNASAIAKKYDVDHSKAYEYGVKIYKLEEVKSIYDVFGDSISDSLDIQSIDLAKISDYLYDESGATTSYLLAAAASAIIKSNDSFIVPITALDEEECVLPVETATILRTLKALRPDDADLEGIDSWDISTLPDSDVRDLMFNSIIMRARLTKEFVDRSRGDNEEEVKFVYVSEKLVTNILDIKGNPRYIINKDEFTYLANALEALSKSDGTTAMFELPDFTIDKIVSLDEEVLKNSLCKSDIILRRLTETIMNDPISKIPSVAEKLKTKPEMSIDLTSDYRQEMEIVSGEAILSVYNIIKSIKNMG